MGCDCSISKEKKLIGNSQLEVEIQKRINVCSGGVDDEDYDLTKIIDAHPEIRKAKDFVDSIIKKGEAWTDPEFPPNNDSIIRPGELNWGFNDIEKITWLRAPEIRENPSLFGNGPEPQDVNQGCLGTCYFLGALVGYAEIADRIRMRFITQETNAAGIYLITLFINGVCTPVIVDNWFPVWKHDNHSLWASTMGKDNKLWVILLEKAWAKIHGSFMRCRGGYDGYVAHHFIGLPAKSIYRNEKPQIDEFWNIIKEWDRRSYIMTVDFIDDEFDEKALGIYAGHTYCMLQTYDIHKDGQNVRLIKIRNTRAGGDEWTGDWSDNSPLWTAEIKQLVGADCVEDGCFFMPLDDFYKLFQRMTGALYHPSPKIATLMFKQQQKAQIKFTLTRQVDLSKNEFAVMFCQQGPRLLHSRTESGPKVFRGAGCRFTLKKENGEVVPMKNTSIDGLHVNFQPTQNMQPGTYHISVDWEWNETSDFEEGYKDWNIRVFCPTELLNLVEFGANVKKGWYFNNSNDFKNGVTQEEAEEVCKENPDTVIGYCWHEAAPEYCFVKTKGCGMGEEEGWNAVVYSN